MPVEGVVDVHVAATTRLQKPLAQLSTGTQVLAVGRLDGGGLTAAAVVEIPGTAAQVERVGAAQGGQGESPWPASTSAIAMQAGPTANLAFQDKVGQPGVSWQSEEFVLPNIRGIFEPLFLPLRLLGCDAQVTMQVFLVAGAGAGWNWRFDLEAGSISPLSIGQDGEITVSVRPLGGNPSFELALGAQAGARFTLRAPNCLGDFSLPGVKIGWSVAARTDAAPPGNGVTLPVAATSCEQLDFVSLMLKLAGIPAAPGLVDFNLGGLEVCPVLEVRGASVTGSIQTPTSRHGPLELPITSSVRLPVRPTGSSIPLTISELQYRPQVVARVHAYGVAFGQRIGGWTSDRLWTIDARATAPNQHLTLSAAPSPVARPAAPANVHGTGISASEIRLTWSDVATNEQGYRVKRWGGAWTTIATLGPGSTTFTDTGLLANSEYAYLVCAYNAAGEACAPNPWLSVKTTAATTVNCSSDQYKAEYFNNRHLSGSPTLTRCESWPINHDWGSGGPGGGVGTDNFSARWTGTAYIAAGTYTFIARADDGIRVWLSNVLIIDEWRDQAPTEFRVTRSVPAGIHSIRVEYYENVFGAVAQFRWEQAATQTPPSTPPRVYAEAISSSQIFVTWGDVDNETSYRLTDNISTFTLAANTTSYTWGGLQANTRKCFSVQAVNGAGSSAWSGWVCATTLPPSGPPTAPANVQGTGISASEIRLTWSDVATNEQGYRVKRWGGAWTTIATLGPGSTTFTDTGLLANSEYAYPVCAYNAAGEACAPDPWLSARTPAGTPPCAPPPGPPGEVVEGRLIVNYRPGYAPHEITDPAAKQRIASAFQTAGVIAQEKAFESLDFRFVRYYILYLSPGTCLTKAYGILMSLPELASVEYSYIAYHFHTADVVSAGVTPAPPP
jgi:hypothetical protein